MRLLLAALVLPLAACGSQDGGGTNALDVVRAAGRRTAEAGSARISSHVSSAAVTTTMTGVAALDDVKGVMTTTFTAPGGRTMVTSETRLLGDLMYERVEGDPAAKPWVRYEYAEFATQKGKAPDEVAPTRHTDPRRVLPYFAAAYGNVRAEDEEEVRGEPTTRYRVSFDLAKAREAATDAIAKEGIELLVEALGTPTLSATVWLDDAGRLRRLTYELDPARAGQALPGGGMTTTTYEFHDFGVAVVVEAPPADQTTDFATRMQ